MENDRLDIVLDETNRTVVDDVSDGQGKEFRSSIYDLNHDLIAEGWGDSIASALLDAWTNYSKEVWG